jgi:hypothetical protein
MDRDVLKPDALEATSATPDVKSSSVGTAAMLPSE